MDIDAATIDELREQLAQASEHASNLQALARLRRTQKIGLYAEQRAQDARAGLRDAMRNGDNEKAEWWAGMAHGLAIVADHCLAMMPEGKWLPEGG